MMEDTLSIVGTGLVVVVTIVLFQRHRMSAYVIPPLDLSTDEDIEVSPMKESEFEIALGERCPLRPPPPSRPRRRSTPARRRPCLRRPKRARRLPRVWSESGIVKASLNWSCQ